MWSLLLCFLTSALEIWQFSASQLSVSSASLSLASYLPIPTPYAVSAWIRPRPEAIPQVLLTLKKRGTQNGLQVVLQNSPLGNQTVEVGLREIAGEIESVGKWEVSEGEWIQVIAYFTDAVSLCGRGETKEIKCLDSFAIDGLEHGENCWIEFESQAEFSDLKLLAGEEREIRAFYLSPTREFGEENDHFQVTSPLYPSELFPLKWTLLAPTRTLMIYGWFYLNDISDGHIMSIRERNGYASLDLSFTSDLKLQACLHQAEVQICMEEVPLAVGKWAFLALGYAEMKAQMCAGGLWDKSAMCVEKDIGRELVVDRVSVALRAEKPVYGVDISMKTNAILTHHLANNAIQLETARCRRSCPLLSFLAASRQLTSTHYSALTYRTYMPSYYAYNWYLVSYYNIYCRCYYSYWVCSYYYYTHYYTFINNHVNTASIYVIADNLGSGGDPNIQLFKLWGGRYVSIGYDGRAGSSWLTIYPANVASSGGITGQYYLEVYGNNGGYTYEVRVRIACNSASLSACTCSAGKYPNPYTSSCSTCSAGDCICQANASLGCIPYVFGSSVIGPSNFMCSRCSAGDQTLDISTGNCIPCNSLCYACLGIGANQCVSCRTGAILTGSPGYSTCICGTGYYPNPTAGSCSSCASSCLNCLNSAAASCTGCKSNAQLSAGSPSACRCNDGYGGEASNCQPCHVTCLTCQLTASNSCVTCKSNALLAAAAPNSCKCLAGYYMNTTSGNCVLCHSYCLTCTGGTPTECTGCKSNAYRLNTSSPSACACITSCYGIPDACTACHSTCSQCSNGGASDCTVCKTNAKLAAASPAACVCNTGFFPSPTVATCAACHPTCLTCTAAVSSKCSTCKTNASLPVAASEGSCSCVLHSFPNPSSANCVLCNSACYSCVGTANNQCSVCYSNASLLNGVNPNTCVCDTGFAPSPAVNNCQPCNPSCKTCSTTLANGCTSCFKYAQLSASPSGTCNCISGLYFDTTLSKCEKCHPNCLTCTGSLSTNCLSCATSETKLANGSCTCTASICPICFSSCATCSGVSRGYCLTCPLWGTLDPPTTPTFCECATSFYPTSISSCGPCSVHCKNCGSGGVNDCIECFPNAILVGGVAPSSCRCLPAFYFPSGSGICDPCDVSCATCQDNTATGCLSCFLNAKLSSGTVNNCVCLDRYFGLGSTATCVLCDDTCYTCIGAADNQCLTCFSHASKAVPTDPSSSCVCSTSYFPNPDVVSCAGCHASCRNCSGSSISQCTECFLPNADLLNGVNPSQCICNSNSFPNSTVANCALCHNDCLTCSSGSTSGCTTCHQYAHLLAGPPGACACDSTYQPMPSVDNCIQCDYTCFTCSAPGSSNCMSCFVNAELVPTPGPSGCDCKVAFYAAPTVATCLPCFSACKLCSGPGEFECTLCYQYASPNGSFPTNCECDGGYYRDPSTPKVCSSCDVSCKTCSAGGAKSCTECFAYASLENVPPTSCACFNFYFPFPDLAHCIICDSTCATCIGIGPTMCNNCFPNASIVGVGPAGECSCNHSFFPDTDVAKCNPCHPTCFQCSGSGAEDCTDCFPLAEITGGNPAGPCDCPDGYYPAPTSETCGLCHSTCRKCVGVKAIECIGCYKNATVDSGFPVYRCICELGFYPEPTPDQCQPCHETCEGCVGNKASDCTSCLSFAKLVLKNSSTGICVCQDGAIASPDSAHCIQCHASCLSCKNASAAACLTCPSFSSLAGPKPNYCLCNTGFYPNPTPVDCQPCAPLICSKCLDFEVCLSCKENAILKAGTCECTEGYMLSADESSCQLCPSDCKRCSDLGCDTCAQHYFLYERMCVSNCPSDYAPTTSNKCEPAVSSLVTLSATADNDLLLEFDKEMNLTLVTPSDMLIAVNDPEQKAIGAVWSSPVPQDKTHFLINLTLDSTYLNPGTEAVLTFYDLSKVVDIQGIPVITESLTCQLAPFGAPPLPPSALSSPLAASTQAASKGTTAASASLAILNGNPGMLTTLVNQMQLMSYIGMTKVKLPSDFAASLSGLNMGFAMSLPYSQTIKPQDSNQPPPQYLSDYGLTTLQFLQNAYSVLMVSGLILLSYLPMYLLSRLRLPVISPYFASKVPAFRWSTPLRIWFTSYLDLGLFSFLQLSNAKDSLSSPIDAISLVVAGVFGLATLATPFLLVYFVHQNQQLILTKSDANFNKNWSALLGEFNTAKGIPAVLFYYLFVTRRAFFFLSLTIACDSPLLIGISSTFLSTASLVYLLSVRPYANKLDQATAIFNEATVLFVYISATSFNFSLGTGLASIMSTTGIWTSRISIFGNMGISALRTAQTVVDLVKAYAKAVKAAARPPIESLSQPRIRWF